MVVRCGRIWADKDKRRGGEQMAKRNINKYERNPMKDENGHYIYPDLKRRTFLSDDKTERAITKVMDSKHWTYSTFIRCAIEYYLKAIENDDLDELAGRL